MKLRTRTRQLANDKWVGEYRRWPLGKWVAADAKDANHRWSPGDMFYGHCQVSTERDAEQALANHLAMRWGV